MIEVFRTNINNTAESKIIQKKIQSTYPKLMIDFDLEDCDKILRIEGELFCPKTVIKMLVDSGFLCEPLD